MDLVKINVKGHVLVHDSAGVILLDADNAIHNQNMAIAIARGLSNFTTPATGGIYTIAFGNGGSNVDSLNQITFLPLNVTSPTATLYSETYSQPVDQFVANTANNYPANSVTWQQSPAPSVSTIVIVTATILASQPPGELITDSPANTTLNSQFAFDELGLLTQDNLLLTHIIFSPILKTQNREIVVTYTLTCSVS
jgi:hypothetical protein